MNFPKILIIEDDDILAKTISKVLKTEGSHISIFHSGSEGLLEAIETLPDLIVLDVVMPGLNGYQVCKEIRANPLTARISILMLSGKGRESDRIEGLSSGADDYLAKPFNIVELALRASAILRRSTKKDESSLESESMSKTVSAQQPHPESSIVENEVLRVGGFSLNLKTFQLKTPARGTIKLTPIQFDLLHFLMGHSDMIFTADALLSSVWNYPSDAGSGDLVRVHIKNIRGRIEENPDHPQLIRTASGYGYTVNPEVAHFAGFKKLLLDKAFSAAI